MILISRLRVVDAAFGFQIKESFEQTLSEIGRVVGSRMRSLEEH